MFCEYFDINTIVDWAGIGGSENRCTNFIIVRVTKDASHLQRITVRFNKIKLTFG
jgi:hypothetical protein